MADMLTSDRGRDRLRKVCGRIVWSCTERGDEKERRAFKFRLEEVIGTCIPRITCKPHQAHLRPRSSHLCGTISRPFFFWRRPANEAFPSTRVGSPFYQVHQLHQHHRNSIPRYYQPTRLQNANSSLLGGRRPGAGESIGRTAS